MRIAVTTPTGNVGGHVVTGLVRAGVRPLVLSRDPARLDPALVDWIDPVVVDQGDEAAVVEATQGVDALYWVNPPSQGDDPVADYAGFGAHAARAVTKNRIARVVFQSSIGAEKRSGAGEIDGLAHTEQLLDESGTDVTHLRCGFFFSNLLMQLDAIKSGTIPIVLPVDHSMSWVAPRDIADVAVGRLLNPDWSGRVVQAVHGPTDLTWKQAAAVIAEVTELHVIAERVSDDAMRETLAGVGLGDKVIEAIMGMSTGLRDGFTPDQPRTPATTTPTTLNAWCYSELRPLL